MGVDRLQEIRARLEADAPCDICALDDAYADIGWLLDEVERLRKELAYVAVFERDE